MRASRAQKGTHTSTKVVAYLRAPEAMLAVGSHAHQRMVHVCMALPVGSDCAHPPAPSLVNPALQIQSEASSLPAGASEFEVHAEHVLSAVAPLAAEYFPAPQSVHASLPLPALYVPAAHA